MYQFVHKRIFLQSIFVTEIELKFFFILTPEACFRKLCAATITFADQGTDAHISGSSNGLNYFQISTLNYTIIYQLWFVQKVAKNAQEIFAELIQNLSN